MAAISAAGAVKGAMAGAKTLVFEVIAEKIANGWDKMPKEAKDMASSRLERKKKIGEWRRELMANLQTLEPEVRNKWEEIFRRYSAMNKENILVERLAELWHALDGKDDSREIQVREELFSKSLPRKRDKDFDLFIEGLANDWLVEAIRRHVQKALETVDEPLASILERRKAERSSNPSFWRSPERYRAGWVFAPIDRRRYVRSLKVSASASGSSSATGTTPTISGLQRFRAWFQGWTTVWNRRFAAAGRSIASWNRARSARWSRRGSAFVGDVRAATSKVYGDALAAVGRLYSSVAGGLAGLGRAVASATGSVWASFCSAVAGLYNGTFELLDEILCAIKTRRRDKSATKLEKIELSAEAKARTTEAKAEALTRETEAKARAFAEGVKARGKVLEERIRQEAEREERESRERSRNADREAESAVRRAAIESNERVRSRQIDGEIEVRAMGFEAERLRFGSVERFLDLIDQSLGIERYQQETNRKFLESLGEVAKAQPELERSRIESQERVEMHELDLRGDATRRRFELAARKAKNEHKPMFGWLRSLFGRLRREEEGHAAMPTVVGEKVFPDQGELASPYKEGTGQDPRDHLKL